MLKKLSSLLKTRTGKLADFDKLKTRLDAVGGDGLQIASELGGEYLHAQNSAWADWLKNKSKASLARYIESKSLYQTWTQSNVPGSFHEHCGHTILAIKNERGNRATLRDCLHLVGEAINADAEAARKELQEAYSKIGASLPVDIEKQQPLASLYRRGEEVMSALDLVDQPRQLAAHEFDGIFALIESSILPVHSATPTAAAPMGILESYSEYIRTAPAVVYGKTHAEQVAESQAEYLKDLPTVPASEIENMPGVGLVRRRQPAPPIMLEPVIGEDGKLVMGKSQHQTVTA